MRKIKQTERPFIIKRFGRNGSVTYDSTVTLDHAKDRAADLIARRRHHLVEVRCRGEMLFKLEVA